MNRLGLVALWVAATFVVTVVAFEVVGAAESQVAERPLTPVVAIDDSVVDDEPTPSTTVTTMTDPTAPTTAPGPSSTTTSAPATSTSSTTTTVPTSVPTTTGGDAAGNGWVTLNVPTAGGTVTVEHRPGEVRLLAVTARSGFAVGTTEIGPPRVRVEFDSPGLRVKVEVEWDDDGPEVDVDEESPDDD